MRLRSRLFSTPPLTSLKRFYRQRWNAWVDARLPAARSHRLNNRRLFIMPTKAGYGFLLVAVLLWLTGTNYDNNLVLALAFLLTAVFVVCIHHTFFNMSGTVISARRGKPCFLNEMAELEVSVSCAQGQQKEALCLRFEPHNNPVWVDLLDSPKTTAKLYAIATTRGWFYPPKLRVESRFPLGLIQCWTWLSFDQPLLVYPKPQRLTDMPLAAGGDTEGSPTQQLGADDFYGFRTYQPGDSPQHIAWKHYARGQGLHVKEYSSQQSQLVWLDYDAMPSLGMEARLSCLCYWVLELSSKGHQFGLRLPNGNVEPSVGAEHQQRVLRRLALFGVNDHSLSSGSPQ